MSGPHLGIVIVGVARNGQTFRPSDWAERLCGCMSLFGEDQRINYSPYLKPIISARIKCVVIDRRLEETDPEAFRFLMSFARDHELQVREGRHEVRRAIQLQAQAAWVADTKQKARSSAVGLLFLRSLRIRPSP